MEAARGLRLFITYTKAASREKMMKRARREVSVVYDTMVKWRLVVSWKVASGLHVAEVAQVEGRHGGLGRDVVCPDERWAVDDDDAALAALTPRCYAALVVAPVAGEDEGEFEEEDEEHAEDDPELLLVFGERVGWLFVCENCGHAHEVGVGGGRCGVERERRARKRL